LIHLILDLTTEKEFHFIIKEGLHRYFRPTHTSTLVGPGNGSQPSSFIREILVTDRPESFVYDIPTYFVRADMLSEPLFVDDLVCKKLTGLDLPTWRAYQHTLTVDTIPRHKKKSTARKLRISAYVAEHTQPEPIEDINYTEVDLGHLQQVIDEMKVCDLYALDVETNALDPYSGNVCMTLSLAHGQAYYIPAELIPRILLHVNWKRVTGANLKYDMRCLDTYPDEIGDDTLLMASLLEVPLGQRSLGQMVKKEFAYQMVEFDDIVPKGESIASIDHKRLVFYSCEDADWVRRLTLQLRPRLTGDKLKIYTIQRRLSPILAEMEQNGLLTDRTALRALRRTQVRSIVNIRREIYRQAGHRLDLNSPVQVGKVLYDELGIPRKRFAKKQASTAEIALQEMSHPIAKAILAYREQHKLWSTYTKPLLEKAHPLTGRVHPEFNPAVASSGRLSCKNPNGQNIPKTPTYRSVVIADDTNSLLKIDFDQLELRGLAGMSGGSSMRRIFESGANIHAHTASIIHGIPVSQVIKDSPEYMDGKRGNFAIVYGAMERKVMEMFGCSFDEARYILQQLEVAFPDEFDFIHSERERIRLERKATTLYGRERTFGDFVPIDAVEREGFSHIIQGSAVELVFLAMIAVMPVIRRYKALLINQIHDEILVECLSTTVHDLRDEIVPMMEAVKFSIPLKVTAKIAPCWVI